MMLRRYKVRDLVKFIVLLFGVVSYQLPSRTQKADQNRLNELIDDNDDDDERVRIRFYSNHHHHHYEFCFSIPIYPEPNPQVSCTSSDLFLLASSTSSSTYPFPSVGHQPTLPNFSSPIPLSACIYSNIFLKFFSGLNLWYF